MYKDASVKLLFSKYLKFQVRKILEAREALQWFN